MWNLEILRTKRGERNLGFATSKHDPQIKKKQDIERYWSDSKDNGTNDFPAV